MSHLAVVTGGTRGIRVYCQSIKNKVLLLLLIFLVIMKLQKLWKSNMVSKTKRWNVADFEDCRRAIKEIEEEYKQPVSILVNNAGITKDKMLHKMSHQDWNDVITLISILALICQVT